MSYTLAFWIGADDLTPREVYARLGEEQHVDGVTGSTPADRDALTIARYLDESASREGLRWLIAAANTAIPAPGNTLAGTGKQPPYEALSDLNGGA